MTVKTNEDGNKYTAGAKSSRPARACMGLPSQCAGPGAGGHRCGPDAAAVSRSVSPREKKEKTFREMLGFD